MGWLPSAPQLDRNPLRLAAEARAAGKSTRAYVIEKLKTGALRFASEHPNHPANFQRNPFISHSNLLGSSVKGHEYMPRYQLGPRHDLLGNDLGKSGGEKPEEVVWRDQPGEGKLDLLLTLDFRMSTSCLYSDIVLPTATWYDKNDLNTSDM